MVVVVGSNVVVVAEGGMAAELRLSALASTERSLCSTAPSSWAIVPAWTPLAIATAACWRSFAAWTLLPAA